jgi:hypothetical protein
LVVPRRSLLNGGLNTFHLQVRRGAIALAILTESPAATATHHPLQRWETAILLEGASAC